MVSLCQPFMCRILFWAARRSLCQLVFMECMTAQKTNSNHSVQRLTSVPKNIMQRNSLAWISQVFVRMLLTDGVTTYRNPYSSAEQNWMVGVPQTVPRPIFC